MVTQFMRVCRPVPNSMPREAGGDRRTEHHPTERPAFGDPFKADPNCKERKIAKPVRRVSKNLRSRSDMAMHHTGATPHRALVPRKPGRPATIQCTTASEQD